MKEIRRESFVEFYKNQDINYETNYEKIKKWFKSFKINLQQANPVDTKNRVFN